MEQFRKHTGRIQALDRADVDTDQIIPKQFLKRIERTGFGEFLFHDWRRSGEIELEQGSSILVAGRNFGCGSSREHAPWALQDFGFKVIIAPSFADIFHTNCTKVGLLPVVLAEDEVRKLMSGGEASVDLEQRTVAFGGETFEFEIDDHVRERLMNGVDDIALTLEHEGEIDSYESTQMTE